MTDLAKQNGDSPAYPHETYYGLTKREEFAKAAMQGFCANPDLLDSTRHRLSAMAYEIADAMLRAGEGE